ncbi:HAD family hydrolase [Fuscovulum ytuae]|uniref:HAD family phosphatase n=1 Tax=Fuscovulum ytuae TaxID=3042299 RepID=A0ABY8Q2F0_9RHOB|nr:HAD family phosphatase [Fuscovulum sp. YMD61]WGV14771.1 HAD family phosphatase [Fuscovulum sp. YMD61]
MRPAAVIFDCDGVVVDSEHPTLVMLRDDLERYGLPLTLEALEAGYVGGTVETVATKARANGAQLPEGWVADFYDRMYAMLRASVPLIPGVVAVLDALDMAGIPYAMGSNGTPEKMQITLGQHGLVERFRGHLYSGQALGRPKPAPDLYLHAAGRLGIPPDGCVVVEDSPAGARAARAAGMRCYGYAPKGAHPALVAEGAILFHDMAELPGILGV